MLNVKELYVHRNKLGDLLNVKPLITLQNHARLKQCRMERTLKNCYYFRPLAVSVATKYPRKFASFVLININTSMYIMRQPPNKIRRNIYYIFCWLDSREFSTCDMFAWFWTRSPPNSETFMKYLSNMCIHQYAKVQTLLHSADWSDESFRKQHSLPYGMHAV